MDLEGAPEDLERDAPGELRAGLLEADRPDEAPRSGVVAEDLDAHDRHSMAHGIPLRASCMAVMIQEMKMSVALSRALTPVPGR